MAMDAPTLKARICRKASQPVGMALSYSRSSRFLVVTRVERGIVKKWNNGQTPRERIAPGDLILMVNGVEGTDGMMAVLRNASILEFHIEFAKSTGAEACDHPELREDLRRTLPGYHVSWSEVTAAVLRSKQASGFLTKGPQYSFELKLLRTGMLELTDPAPKPKNAKHRQEFERVSALIASVGWREVLRRQDSEGGADGEQAPPAGLRGAQELEQFHSVLDQPPVQPVQPELWTYTPVNGKAITARGLPKLELNGNRTGKTLRPGDTFQVIAKKKVGEVTFLRLSGGEGWLFDTKPNVGLMCTKAAAPAPARAIVALDGLGPNPHDNRPSYLLAGAAQAPAGARAATSPAPVEQAPRPTSAWREEFSFVGAVGGRPGSRPNGKFTNRMKVLAGSHRKGELSEEEFQQKAAAVVGWELQAV